MTSSTLTWVSFVVALYLCVVVMADRRRPPQDNPYVKVDGQPTMSGANCPPSVAFTVVQSNELVTLQAQLSAPIQTQPLPNRPYPVLFAWCTITTGLQLLVGRSYTVVNASYPVHLKAPTVDDAGTVMSGFYFGGQTKRTDYNMIKNAPGKVVDADSVAVDVTPGDPFTPPVPARGGSYATYASATLELTMNLVFQHNPNDDGYYAITAAKPVVYSIIVDAPNVA